MAHTASHPRGAAGHRRLLAWGSVALLTIVQLCANWGAGAWPGTAPAHAMAAAVQAAPAISLSRTQGPPGAAVRVRGFYFEHTTVITVSLGGTPLVTATSTSAGSFAANLTVPSLPPGPYTLAAQSSGGLISSVTFVVTARAPARLVVGPARVLPGGTVSLVGAQFAATETVVLNLVGTTVSTTTTAAGTFAVSTTLPLTPPGLYGVTARGETSGLVATAALRVIAAPRPALLVRPSSAPAGSTVLVLGHSFTPGVVLTLTLAGAPLTTTVADSTGAVAVSITVPPLSPGLYSLAAQQGTGDPIATAPLRVVAVPVPALILTPSRSVTGASLTARGYHFGPSEGITLSLGTTIVATITAGANGAFITHIVVPPLAAGVYSATAAGPPGAPTAATTFTLLAPPPPHVIVSRLAARPGWAIEVRGSHFGATETIQLALASVGVATATTTAAGAFTAHFIVPPLAAGMVTLSVVGATSGISLAVPFRVLAPPPPAFGLSRRSGPAGATITAQGKGFGPHELIAISFGDIAALVTTTTTMEGSFATTLTVPVVALGHYLVTARGVVSTISAAISFAVVAPPTPAVILSRHAGSSGTIVAVRGYHFGAHDAIVLSIGATQVAMATADGAGTFAARFVVPALATGTYSVTALGSPSAISASSFFVVNPPPFGAVTGSVTDGASAAGMAGAIVHAVQAGTGRSATTVADASGVYSMTLRTGYWRLDATIADGQHLRVPPVTVYIGAAAVVVQNLVAPRAPALLEGSVYGPPTTVITVSAWSRSDSSRLAVTTDTTGHATYTLGATIGLWHVGATLPDASRAAFDAPHSRAVAVTQVGTAASPQVYSTGLTLTFIPAPYTIVVHVVDTTGAPVTSSVWVSAWSPDFVNGGIGVSTSENTAGIFTLHVAAAVWNVRAYRHDAPSPVGQRIVVNPANPNVPVTFVLQPTPNTISGFVYNRDSQPLAGAVVDARAADGETISARTSLTGTYTLHVFSSTWNLLAFAPQLGLIGRASVVVSAGVNPTQDFAAPLTFHVGGRVRVGNAPLAFASLHAYAVNGRNQAQTALDGSYSMALPLGAYTMRGYAVQAGGLGDTFFTVGGNIDDQDWNLPAQGTLRIRVQVGGVPLNDPTGTAARVSGWDPYTGYWNATSDDPGGIYTLPLLAGIYTVRVSLPGQGQLEVRNVQVLADGAQDLTFNFTAYGTVQGTVVDPSQAPLAGVAVFLDHGRIHVRTVTDPRGYYALQVQPGITYHLGAEQPGYVLTDARQVQVSAGATQTVSLTMAPATSRVSGDLRVAGTAGAPAVYAWMWATDHHGGYASARSDGFGNWALKLTPGLWFISARFDGYHTAVPVEVTVPPSGLANLHLLLTPVATFVPPLPAAATFDPRSAIALATPNNALEVQVPANAAGLGDTTDSMNVQETMNVPDTLDGTPLGGRGFEVTVADAAGNPLPALNATMTLNFTYDLTQLPAGAAPTALSVGYLDTTTSTWQPLPFTLDMASHTITVATTHLGTFALLLPGQR